MALRQDEMQTSNNKQAEAGLPADSTKPKAGTNVNGFRVDGGDDNPIREGDDKWINMVKAARTANESYMSGPKMRWAQAYRAYNNQHFSDSKYLSDRWRGRSKLHRPKTRNSVHKADARAANALFASQDVVQTTAPNPADPKQQASADIGREILNYRLDRSSGKAGVPWFQIAIGAHNDARLTGVCISKQYWERREVQIGWEPVMAPPAPVLDEVTGQPMMDPMSGQVLMGEPTEVMEADEAGVPRPKVKPVMKVVRDRPMIRLYPVEYVWRDPAADWLNQVESSSYIGLLHPMSIGDARAMLTATNEKSAVKWRPLTESQLAHCSSPLEVQSTQAAREQQTTNRFDHKSGTHDFNTCWLIEWFVRDQGREYHFWTGACMYLASEPVLVEEAYPFNGGERPVVIGYSSLEPHKIDPMSPVQAALPLQQEMNDLVNLRMDGVKENVRPLTVVKAGAQIDANAIQNRSGDTVIYTKDPKEDVHFDRPAAIGAEAYTEMAHLNADFDDTTGEFNGASVAMNRQIGETVGGMKLLNTSANVTGDFDLRIWIETWVEPVLRQVMKVIQYYEDDQTILMIAAQKAKLWQKYRVDAVTDEMLDREIFVTVSAGIGTADPAVALEKFAMAGRIVGAIIGESAQARIKQDPVIDEVFGKAGFKNAAERFFHEGDQTDPRITQMQEVIGKLQAELENESAERANNIELARIKVAGDLLKQYLDNIAAMETAQVQHEQDVENKVVDHASKKDLAKTTGEQRLKEIKAKPVPGKDGKPAAAPKSEEPSPTGDNPIMANLLAAMAQMLAPQQGGPLTPPAAGGAPAGAQPGAPAAPDPMQMIAGQMQQMMATAQQQNQMLMAQMAQMQQVMMGMMQSQQQLTQVMAAPKRVVRSPDGRAQGIEIDPGMMGGGQPALPSPAAIQ